MHFRIQTPSRLHFGLLSLPGSENDSAGDVKGHPPGRRWGGAGLMIQKPGIELSAVSARDWSASGPLSDRVMHFANRILSNLQPNSHPQPLQFHVVRSAPEHQGLGTGTQLALAVARIIAQAASKPDNSAAALAKLVGRGNRSAIGVHGFEQGGFLVEAGKRDVQCISPLVARVDFPAEWRILLILSDKDAGLHGPREREAFKHLRGIGNSAAHTEQVCRIILMDVLPALHEQDLVNFGEALYEFNRKVGELFRPIQGGIYALPRSEEIVSFIRKQNVHGVGQSSWGPGLFAIVGSETEALQLAVKLTDQFSLNPREIVIAQAANLGARFSTTMAVEK